MRDKSQDKGHEWPTEPREHVWGDWMAHTPRKGVQKPTQYRLCVHPQCSGVEYRDAPQAP